MITDLELEKQVKIEEWKVSYKQIGLLILFFLVGLITALLFDNAQIGTTTTFTTTELVGFILAVVLSGASIVLAVSAIAFGKISEQAVVLRCDESARLQNDIFLKTSEALQKIEAHAEAAGRRFEDIVEDRIGDISRNVTEFSLRGEKGVGQKFQEVEEEIREIIALTLKEEKAQLVSKEKAHAEQLERTAQNDPNEKEYQKNHKKLLKEFAKKEGFTVVKSGHGRITDSGDDLFDGVLKTESTRVGVSTFRSNSNIYNFQVYLLNAAREVEMGHVGYVFIVCFKNGEEEQLLETMKKDRGQLKKEIKNRIIITSIAPENIKEEVQALSLPD